MEKNKVSIKRKKGYPKVDLIHFFMEEIPSANIIILTDKFFLVLNNNKALLLGKRVKTKKIKK